MTDNAQHMAVLDEVESSLKVIEEQGKEVVDFSTDEGYARAKEIKKPLVRLRTTGDKARLAATKFHREEQSRINDLWNGIAERIEAVEGPLTEGIKRIDDEAKRVKAVAAEAEQLRIQNIKDRIADIRAAAGNAISLDDVTAAITRYGNVTLESFDELAEDAERAIADMDTALAAKKTALQAQVDEAARIAQQKAEQDKREAHQKAEREKFEAEQKEAADKLAEQKAEIERGKRELAESQAAEERRKADAIAETKRKEEQAARDKAAADQAENDKQAALVAAEVQRLADIEAAKQQAIADEQARVEAEQAQAAAEKVEADRVAAEAPDKDKLLAWVNSIPLPPKVTTKAGKDAALNFASIVDQMRAKAEAIGTRRKKAA